MRHGQDEYPLLTTAVEEAARRVTGDIEDAFVQIARGGGASNELTVEIHVHVEVPRA